MLEEADATIRARGFRPMYIQTRSQREEYQRIIVRKTQAVRKWVSEKLDGTEL
jgi:hypothetical protein